MATAMWVGVPVGAPGTLLVTAMVTAGPVMAPTATSTPGLMLHIIAPVGYSFSPHMTVALVLASTSVMAAEASVNRLVMVMGRIMFIEEERSKTIMISGGFASSFTVVRPQLASPLLTPPPSPLGGPASGTLKNPAPPP